MLLQTLSVTVRSDRKKVFSTLSKVENIPLWNSQTTVIELTTKGKERKGYEFLAGDGKKMYHYRVSEYKPDTRFQFVEEGGVGFVGTLTLRKLNNNTKIEFAQEVEDSLFFKLFKPIVKSMLKKSNQEDEELLKQLFEK